MSTKDDPDLARQTLEYGASLCLPKPFTPDDLRRALACVGIEVT
jgi:DNA-binding NarL/FixJ family response regulator